MPKETGDLIKIDEDFYCIDCKPQALQSLKENTDPESLDEKKASEKIGCSIAWLGRVFLIFFLIQLVRGFGKLGQAEEEDLALAKLISEIIIWLRAGIVLIVSGCIIHFIRKRKLKQRNFKPSTGA